MPPSRSQVEAARIRADLGLGSGYVDVFDIARRLGAEIYFHPFGDDGVEGAYKLVDGLAFILINADRPLVRRRFSVAHEIGHMRLGGTDSGVVESAGSMYANDPEERNANRFAAYLLMDPDGVVAKLDGIDEPIGRIAAVATEFVVSPMAATIHLAELGFVSMAVKDNYVALDGTREAKTLLAEHGYEAPRNVALRGVERIDVRHLDDALTAFAAGQYSRSALAADFDLSIAEVDELLRLRGLTEPVPITGEIDLRGFDDDD